MTSPYRQDDAARQMRVAETYARALDRLAALPALALDLLPDAERAALERLRRATEAAHAAAIDDLEQREALVDQLDRLSRDVDASTSRSLLLRPVTPPRPTADPVPYLYEEPTMRALRLSMEKLTDLVDPSARALRLGDNVYGATLTLEGAPVCVRVEQFERSTGASDITEGWMMQVPTRTLVWSNAPAGYAGIRLAPQRAYHAVGKALGITDDLELGDAEFDAAFLVRCPAHLVARVLPAPVRRAMLEARGFRMLTVEKGRASVHLREGMSQLTVVHVEENSRHNAQRLARVIRALVTLRAALLP